jgi:hypothetical protein
MFAQPLWAEFAAVDRVILIAAHCNGLPVFDANFHAAAH